jgi:putative membrane protein
MANDYWTNMSSDWLLIFGFVVIFLLFSSAGNWGYTYHVHRKIRHLSPALKKLDDLAERYAKGQIKRDEFQRQSDEISSILHSHRADRIDRNRRLAQLDSQSNRSN